MRLFSFLFIAIFAAYFATASSIKAVVNNDIITAIELNQRAKLAALFSGGKIKASDPKLQRDILEALIDEKIKLQAAHSIKRSVSEAEVDKIVSNMEQKNKMPEGTLSKMLGQQGLSIEYFKDQVRAQLAWRNYVRAVVSKDIKDRPYDIERLLDQELQKGSTITEYLIGEIFIPTYSGASDAAAKATAERVRRLAVSSPTPFGELARNFSSAPSRTEDGISGWVISGQLEPALDQAIKKLSVGGTSSVIRTDRGFYVLRLLKKRNVNSKKQSDLEGLRKRINAQYKNELLAKEAAYVGRQLRQQAYIEIR